MSSYGYIVLADNKKGFVPSAIKWFTKSKFSHSFIMMPDILGLPMCIEAAEGGVDFTEFDKSYKSDPNEGYEIWNIKIDQSIKDCALRFILKELETSYGFMQFIFFVWRRINLLFGRDIKNKNNWFTNGMICSQLCVEYIKACGLENTISLYGNGSISPQDLQDIFKSHPDYFQLVESVKLNDQ